MPAKNDGSDEPQVIFGIDIGMCFTKVAYTYRKDNSYADVRDFRAWASLGVPKNSSSLVPTVLAYEKGHNLQDHAPQHIGFLEAHQRNDKDLKVHEWFKDHFPGNLPPPGQESAKYGDSTLSTSAYKTDTMILYYHFMKKIYVAIKSATPSLMKELEEHGFNWDDTYIEFIFSVPATWNRLTETLDDVHTRLFKEIVTEAGFGRDNSKHKVLVRLTEPEAAAAFASTCKANQGHLQDGRRILVVDAGGGTTDICLLINQHSKDGRIRIDPLSAPVGEELGSSHIDREFEKLARSKLKKIADSMGLTDRWNIDRMGRWMRDHDDYQDNKKRLNLDKIHGGEFFTVPLPRYDGVPEVLEGDDIVNHKLKFDWLELARIFDERILQDRPIMKRGRPETVPGIIKLIHRERDRLRHRGDLQNSPTSSKETYADIDVILLSGGLGSSDYIKYKIEESLRDGVNGVTASMPKVCTLTEPQNCICRGLLEDRMLGLWRAGKCNGSYGLLEKEPYRRTKPKHMLARLSKHLSVNGDKKFVEQVKWLIRKDEAKPVSLPVHRYTFCGSDPKEFVVEVVVSNDPKPSTYPSREDFVARVQCDDGEPARDDKTGKMYCNVEVLFHVARFEVNCFIESPTRRIIGRYKGNYNQLGDRVSFMSS